MGDGLGVDNSDTKMKETITVMALTLQETLVVPKPQSDQIIMSL